jgi:hypothetical protein
MKSEFLKLAGLIESSDAASADAPSKTAFAKNSNEIASVKSAVRKAVKHCEHEADTTKSPNSRKVCEADAEAYDNILGLINAGKQAMARKRWADMDTATRNVIFDLTTDKAIRKLIAEYFGTALLHESEDSDDSAASSSTEEKSDDADEIVDKDIADLKALVSKLEKAQEKDNEEENDSADTKVTVSIAKIKADLATLIKNQQADDVNEGVDNEDDDIPTNIKNSRQGTKVRIHQPTSRFNGAVGRLTGIGTKGSSEVEFDDFPTSMHDHKNIKLLEAAQAISETTSTEFTDYKEWQGMINTKYKKYNVTFTHGKGSESNIVWAMVDSATVGVWNKDSDTGKLYEAANYLGDREYQTYSSWKTACKKAYPGCGFRGDIDIGAATLNGKDVGEWDGAVGSVYNKDSLKESAEAYKDMSDKQLTIWAKLENIEDDIKRDHDGAIANRAEIIKKLTDTLKESDGINFAKASDSELKKYAAQAGIEDSIVLDGEGDIENRDEIIKLLKADQVNEDADTPTKVINMTDAVKPEPGKADPTTKVPTPVVKAVNDKIKELEDELMHTAHLQSQEQQLVNIIGAIRVLNSIKNFLNDGSDESMKKISILLTSLEGAQKVLIPKEVWKYMSFDYANPLANKSSLMDKFKEIKAYSTKQ